MADSCHRATCCVTAPGSPSTPHGPARRRSLERTSRRAYRPRSYQFCFAQVPARLRTCGIWWRIGSITRVIPLRVNEPPLFHQWPVLRSISSRRHASEFDTLWRINRTYCSRCPSSADAPNGPWNLISWPPVYFRRSDDPWNPPSNSGEIHLSVIIATVLAFLQHLGAGQSRTGTRVGLDVPDTWIPSSGTLERISPNRPGVLERVADAQCIFRPVDPIETVAAVV